MPVLLQLGYEGGGGGEIAAYRIRALFLDLQKNCAIHAIAFVVVTVKLNTNVLLLLYTHT